MQLCKIAWNMYGRNSFLADADRAALAVWWHLSRHFRFWRLIYNLINASNVNRKPVGWGLQRSPWQDRHSSRGGWRWHRLAPAIKATIKLAPATKVIIIVSSEQISFQSYWIDLSVPKWNFQLENVQTTILTNPLKTPKSCNSSPSWTRTPRPFRLPFLDSE